MPAVALRLCSHRFTTFETIPRVCLKTKVDVARQFRRLKLKLSTSVHLQWLVGRGRGGGGGYIALCCRSDILWCCSLFRLINTAQWRIQDFRKGGGHFFFKSRNRGWANYKYQNIPKGSFLTVQEFIRAIQVKGSLGCSSRKCWRNYFF